MDITRHMTKNPQTIGPDTLITTAGEMLRDNNFRHLPIVDDDGCLLGMVTDRDLRSALPSTLAASNLKKPVSNAVAQIPVREIMSREIIALNNFSTIDDALILFDRKKVGALPVVDDHKRLIGIFSTRDLITAYRNLFGLGEKGSALVAVENDDKPRPLSRIVHIMEEHDIHFSRIIQQKRQEERQHSGIIYIRVNTCNLHAVHTALQEAGIKIL